MLPVVVLAAMGLIAATSWVLRASDRTFEVGYGIELKRAVGHRIWTVLEHGQTAAPGTIDIDSIEPPTECPASATGCETATCAAVAPALCLPKEPR